MTLDLAAIRRQFPALADEWIFFDNAGGSQILGRAIDRIAEFLRTSNVQLGGTYALSRRAGERVHEGARALSRWMGCDPSEVVIGSSTTQLLANLASSMTGQLARGDEIVVTDLDHESNIGCWRRLEERGVVVKEWPVDAGTQALRVEELLPLLTPRTRLVCFTHASNLVGTVHPVAAITRVVHEHGARVCVDGVAYAPHRPLDVRAWDVDYYVFSVYKVYGPHLAALYGKRQLLAGLRNINHFFIGDDAVPYKLQPGNVTYELVHALPAVVDYLESLSFDEVAAHETRLAARLLSFLGQVPRVRVLGERAASATRVPTVSFVVEGRSSAEVVRAVDPHRIGIKQGDFYARRFVERLGLAGGGVVRVSMVHYNTLEEVDRLIAVLEPALSSRDSA
jgi:cysteine desulfurase family protein (TIGR01976 family)